MTSVPAANRFNALSYLSNGHAGTMGDPHRPFVTYAVCVPDFCKLGDKLVNLKKGRNTMSLLGCCTTGFFEIRFQWKRAMRLPGAFSFNH